MKLTPQDLVECHQAIPLETLRTLEGNAHRADREALRRSLDTFGQFESIAVWNGEILIGNHRVEEAKALGWESLAGYDFSRFDLDTAERLARALASNRIAQLGTDDESALADLIAQIDDEDLLTAAGFDGAALLESEPDGVYSRKVETPVYEIKGDRPTVDELFDTTRADELIEAIDNADIDAEIKMFLRSAAERHTRFRFDRIAEFYAHADPAVQELFEASALVIIDFDQAIEHGFVKLSDALVDSFIEDHLA